MFLASGFDQSLRSKVQVFLINVGSTHNASGFDNYTQVLIRGS